jgi:galactokinase
MSDNCQALIEKIEAGSLDGALLQLYGEQTLDFQKKRYLKLLEQLAESDVGNTCLLVSAPGRTELGGNHTDHNHGNVLAAAVDRDCVAAVTAIDHPVVELVSDGYSGKIIVDLRDLQPQQAEEGTAQALIRGMAAGIFSRTGKIGGFSGYLHATFRPGTGLSSSAAFSVLIGGIFNFLYAEGMLSAEQLAHVAGEAENHYFGKPSGLMDQMSSAVGGTVAIDFNDRQHPFIRKVSMPRDLAGYRLVVVDTGGSHVELTPEYASSPREMKDAAGVLGHEVARGITLEQVMAKIPEIRSKAGDRALLRLLHFIHENDRAVAMAEALKNRAFAEYLSLVRGSGLSSALMLQNCAVNANTREQGILLGLALTGIFCPEAVSRVHGGGFAGTIQVYVPEKCLADYMTKMNEAFAAEAVMEIFLGRPGVCAISANGLILSRCECEE